MKDEELQCEEIEVFHKLGGAGEGRVQGRENKYAADTLGYI